LIERLNSDGVDGAGTLAFARTRHSAVDARFLVVAGRDEPVLDRTAFELLKLPSENFSIKLLHRFWISRVNFKMSYAIHISIFPFC
jgi:hypothetical protein